MSLRDHKPGVPSNFVAERFWTGSIVPDGQKWILRLLLDQLVGALQD